MFIFKIFLHVYMEQFLGSIIYFTQAPQVIIYLKNIPTYPLPPPPDIEWCPT